MTKQTAIYVMRDDNLGFLVCSIGNEEYAHLKSGEKSLEEIIMTGYHVSCHDDESTVNQFLVELVDGVVSSITVQD